MDENAIVEAVIHALHAANIPHMIVGSLSSNAYGIPRSTKDADLVVQLGSFPLGNLLQFLPEGFVLDPQIGFETITATTRFRLHFVNRTIPFTVELFELSNDAHDQTRFARRVESIFANTKTCIPKAEDVVIMKLRWAIGRKNREKDVDDARNVLAVQKGNLDLDYIRKWCDTHNTRELLEQTLQSIPGAA